MTRVRAALAGRGLLLFPAAAFAVHQLRYELAYGSHSGAALAAQGHGYQNSLAPWVVLLLAVGTGSFLARLARAAAGRGAAGRRRPFAGLFLLTWALLLVAYCAQEWLEGAFASGHPAGLTGIFGHGGWWAVPLAAGAALAVAALLALATAAVELAERLAPPAPVLALVSRPRLAPVVAAPLAPLARSAAGRAPPRVASY